MVAGGIFAGFFLLAIEIAFKRRKERQEKDIQVSRSALVHWRKRIEVSNDVLQVSIVVPMEDELVPEHLGHGSELINSHCSLRESSVQL